MKLLVLGATGGTGRQIVTQALDAGHEVTVLARDPDKVGVRHDRLRVVGGDVKDVAVLADAMRGQGAVISAIGRGKSFKSENLIAASVPGIISAMGTNGIARLVFTSALGVGDSYHASPLVPKIFFRTLLRGIYADKLIGDQMIRNSRLDWTIVQPVVLTDDPPTRKYRVGEQLQLSGINKVSRADAAHYIVNCVNDQSTFGKTLILSN
jgi:putative NADH-flavin reductase